MRVTAEADDRQHAEALAERAVKVIRGVVG